jgi:AAHS family 4-hydroxybenzoate transporter-like MFS transporter
MSTGRGSTYRGRNAVSTKPATSGESLRLLLTRGVRTASALRIYADTGINPDAAAAARYVDGAETTNTVVALFTDGYAMRTILFWIMFFASLLRLYLIGFWLPTVLHLEGLSPSDAVFAASIYSAGGGLSVLLLGPLANRLGTDRVLTICLACSIVIVGAGALGRLPYLILLMAIFIMGICVVGGKLGANGLSAAKYPARIRTTGVGWALGIGRLGRHCRPWSRRLSARSGLEATAHPSVRLPDRCRRRDLCCTAATARRA